MKRFIPNIFICLLVAVVVAGCAGGRHAGTNAVPSKTAAEPSPAISHNDSLRFKMYYYEAIKQQVGGNLDAAYDLLRHSIEINPYAAEAYFLLSSYDGVLKGDSAALEDIKKAAELNPSNNAYLERLGTGYIHTGDLAEAINAYNLSHTLSREINDNVARIKALTAYLCE